MHKYQFMFPLQTYHELFPVNYLDSVADDYLRTALTAVQLGNSDF